jgi:epoxyqueuosine reductase
MDRTQRVLELARDAGFDLAGIAPLRPPADLQRFDRWLELGRNAGLAWLRESRDRIANPGRLLPEGQSILVVGLAHSRAAIELEGGSRVARYAAGRDYHNVVGRKLRKLRSRLVEHGLYGRGQPFRKVVDAGPLLERSHAAEAGLGFASKAANLLHPSFGPWFFLGELLLELDLEPTPAVPAGSCGTCRLCLDACPTAAIVAPGQVDANLCLSYHTIESPAPIPEALRPAVGPWAFGCDVCSEVCPWGGSAPDVADRFGTHAAVEAGPSVWLSTRDDAAFEQLTLGSPLRRPGRAGLARNAAIALGNHPTEEGGATLLEALSFDPDRMVREAAAWGLARGYGRDAGVRPAIERAAAAESDPDAADELRSVLRTTEGR